MILETAILEVIPGKEAAFEKDFQLASQYISSIDGYRGHSLQKCIEQSNKYLLLVHWRSLEDHTEGFRGSEVYQSWKALLHHYYRPFPEVLHFSELYKH